MRRTETKRLWHTTPFNRAWRALSLCVVALLGSASPQDVSSVRYVQRYDRLRDIAFVPAKQRCENWALGAVLQSVLEMQGVAIPQAKWVAKLGGTDVCSPFLKVPAAIASTIEGDYRLDNADTVHLQAIAEDTFVQPGKLVKAIQENRPFIWIWKSHTFMAVSIQYVEQIDDASGARQYDIRQIDLLDPFAGAEQQPVVFKKTTASLKEVGGIVEVIATR
jgi:hypothetical protein